MRSERALPAEGGSVAVLDAPDDVAGEQDGPVSPPWWAAAGADDPGPLTVGRPDLGEASHGLERVLASHLDGHDLHLPPLPHVPSLVLQQLQKTDWNSGDLAGVISEDQVLTASVLRVANSPIYRGLAEITALRPAISRLGAVALRTLMMHHALHGAVFHGRVDRERATLIWQRSVASAAVMRLLARFAGRDAEEAFLIGLLHDIGDVVVLRQMREYARLTHYSPDDGIFHYLCHEYHQQFGGLVAANWRLPDKLTALIRDHHTHPRDDDPLRADRLSLQLADLIVVTLGYGVPAAFNILETRAAQGLGLAERGDSPDFLSELPGHVSEHMAWL